MRELSVNEHSELVAETALGHVKFTKPIAYQEIDDKRVYVECGYVIAKDESKTTDFTDYTDIKGTNSEFQITTTHTLQLATVNSKLETDTDNGHDQRPIYGFKLAAYDKTKELIIDPLLASTYLGGNGTESGQSLAIDTGGNVYVTGWTFSSDFPTTPGAYYTSFNGSSGCFISKLDSNLSANISGVTGTLSADKTVVDVNDLVTITVVDSNLNTNPS
jgi:hypothetical protein